MKVTLEEKEKAIPMVQTEIGDLMIIEDTSFSGIILLRTSDNFVNLENPRSTWLIEEEESSFLVRVLPKGTKITLEVE